MSLTYNPSLQAPGIWAPDSYSSNNTTSLSDGIYSYKVTGEFQGNQESSSVLFSTITVSGNYPEPEVFVRNNGLQSDSQFIGYRVYRKGPGDVYYNYVNSFQISGLFGGIADQWFDYGYTADTAIHTPEEQQELDSITATGFTFIGGKSRMFAGDPFSLTIAAIPSSIGRFPQGTIFTLTDNDGHSTDYSIPTTGGNFGLTLASVGSKTITLTNNQGYANPSSFSVTILPGLRVTGHRGLPPAQGDADNGSTLGYFAPVISTLQGRNHLLFGPGDNVGFIIPYSLRGNDNSVNEWEIYDFNGTMTDSGTCNVSYANSQSDTIFCQNVFQPGAYSLFLYNTNRSSSSSDFAGIFRFVVVAQSRSGLALEAESAANAYDGTNQRFARLNNAAVLTSESNLNGYVPSVNDVRCIHRSFTFTPTQNVTMSISCSYAQIEVNAVVLQPYVQLSGPGPASYTVQTPLYTAGQSYNVVVKNFLRPNSQGSADGWTLPDIIPSVNGTFTGTIASELNTLNKVTVNDYTAFYTDEGGDHNDLALRASLGEAGSLIRYQVYNTSQASDFSKAIATENLYILGVRDASRERRRIIFNFPDLAPVQHQADAGQTTLQTYSSSGITTFINGLISLGLSPNDFVVEGSNEPQDENTTFYGTLMARLYDAVKAANSSVQVVGPSAVSLGDGGLSFALNAITASGNKVDGISAHIYNSIYGDYADGKITFDQLAAWVSANNFSSKPLWQTEQGADYPYHGTVYMRYSPRLVLAQKLLLERYGIPAARDLYWAPTNDWAPDPTAYTRSNFGVFSVYPVFLALRTWGDEIFGLTYNSSVSFGGDWDKQLWGNLYTSLSGSMMALSTNGAKSFLLAMTVSGSVSSISARTWDGKDMTIPVNNGIAVLPLDEMILYVRIPPGVTLTPNLPTLGTNLALAATLSTSESTSGSVSLLNDGVTAGSTRVSSFGGIFKITVPTSQQDDEVVMDFGSAATFNQVHISCPFMFQGDGTLLDFALQSWDGTNWNTIQNVTQLVNGVPAPSVLEGSRLDDYSDRSFQFLLYFNSVTSSKMRVLIYSASYGVSPTKAMSLYGSVDTPTVNQPTMREIAVYNTSGATMPTSSSPIITSAITATSIVGTAFNYQILATNNPTSYNASGLPAGLTIATSSGEISGMPTTIGTYTIGISATNSSGTTNGALTLTVTGTSGGGNTNITNYLLGGFFFG